MFVGILNILSKLINVSVERKIREKNNIANEITISKYNNLFGSGFGFVTYGNTDEEASKEAMFKLFGKLKWYYTVKLEKWLKLK